MFFTEELFENAVIELFEGMGYTHIYAPDMNRDDFSSPIMESILLDCLVRINKKLPIEAIHEAVAKIKNFEGGSIVHKNRIFTGYLQNGIEVKYFYKGEEYSSIVYLIDYSKADNKMYEETLFGLSYCTTPEPEKSVYENMINMNEKTIAQCSERLKRLKDV